ncbi:hypothetical protein C8J57DRAFT_1537686 [Mycena rebaudengoi]|nr:hypothetical protein C8J57DRAFT_1537686 [Mycena rebaudengoi]
MAIATLMLNPTLTPAPTQYYCYPPLHPDSDYKPGTAKDFWLALNPDCRLPGTGVYTSWGSCQAAAEGVSGEGGVHYGSYAACIPPWQTWCRLGHHIHPIDPALLTPTSTAIRRAQTPNTFQGLAHTRPQTMSPSPAVHKHVRTPSATVIVKHDTAPLDRLPAYAIEDGDSCELPVQWEMIIEFQVLHYTVQGSDLVTSDYRIAKATYQCRQEKHGAASMCTTTNLRKAILYAPGMSDEEAEILAGVMEAEEVEKETQQVATEERMRERVAQGSAHRLANIHAALGTGASTPHARQRTSSSSSDQLLSVAEDLAFNFHDLKVLTPTLRISLGIIVDTVICITFFFASS